MNEEGQALSWVLHCAALHRMMSTIVAVLSWHPLSSARNSMKSAVNMSHAWMDCQGVCDSVKKSNHRGYHNISFVRKAA